MTTKGKKLPSLVDHLANQFGQENVRRLSDESVFSRVKNWYSTGSLALDLALGGGIPMGRIIEIFGGEGSGKTTLALSIIAGAQANGAIVMYLDTENAVQPEYAATLGVDIDNLILSQCNSVEAVFRLLKEAALWVKQVDKSGQERLPIVIVWDSVAATPTETEGEDIDDKTMASLAGVIAKLCRRVFGLVAEADITLLCLNHAKEKLGSFFGVSVTTPGGKSIKFHATQRIQLSAGKKIKESEEIVGQLTNFQIVKNKVFPPFKRGKIPLIFGEGFSYVRELVEHGLEFGVFEKSGSYIVYVKTGEKYYRKDWCVMLADSDNVAIEEEILEAVWNA